MKNTNTWRLNNTLLNNTLLNNQEITEEIKEEIKKYLETDDNENTMTHNLWDEERNQDGRVEGRALTPSCKNTRITTTCWTIIDRKTLELTKKDTPHPKTKEKPQ